MAKQLALYAFICSLCLLVLTSCSIVKRQYGHVEPVKAFSPKNYHEVLTQMGAPDSVAILNDAFVFAYHSVLIDEPQLGLTIPNFDLFKFTLGSATATHYYHFYSFSLQGKVINLQKNHWQQALGESSAIELIFMVEETVDLANFEVPRATNLWGQRLLINKSLNEITFEEIVLAKRLDLIGQDY
jgi:hypothetical protein